MGLGVGIDKLLAVVWFAFDPSIGEVIVGQLKLLPQKYRSSVQALVQLNRAQDVHLATFDGYRNCTLFCQMECCMPT